MSSRRFTYSSSPNSMATTSLGAAPQRLESNVDGPLYVNDRCINCSACAMFAPSIFQSNSLEGKHVVHHQPQSEQDIDHARAALSACPVAAIRVETSAQRRQRHHQPAWTESDQTLSKQLAMYPKLNGRDLPFPRRIHPDYYPQVYFMGHHNEKSFGATPYLFYSSQHDQWIMVDTPRFGPPAVQALERATQGRPPDVLILSHVDDTADHGLWKDHYPNLQRIFHSGDLGPYNWIGDQSLEQVEILLTERTTGHSPEDVTTLQSCALQAFDCKGNPISSNDNDNHNNINDQEVVIFHTPGHSPGSISVLFRPHLNRQRSNDDPTDNHDIKGVLFTGDTYAYRLSSNVMTGFPRFGNDRTLQARILQSLVHDWGTEWDLLAPGHGHVRDYSDMADTKEKRYDIQKAEVRPAIDELKAYVKSKRW